jgi:hypothetical protein
MAQDDADGSMRAIATYNRSPNSMSNHANIAFDNAQLA